MDSNQPLSYVKRLLTVLLIMSVAANGTQTIVLCLGSDEHVAIELAGHQHCQSAHDPEEIAEDSFAFMAAKDGFFRPCVDIPLSLGILDDPNIQQALRLFALSAGIVPSIVDSADHTLQMYTVAGVFPTFISFYYPLTSIILIM